ncbi:glutathione S-transferase family protein [Flavisphingomonas formosensis]|uniref:glutathione S-transferase family protein n=1 Tax=Flavisphingomonas formosensis TaxID=861534 RepID=UPI0018E03914|nr:glutathione S-transferase N-terminal domain-containing protein [Sphingomonas formosensis]
MLRFYFHHTPNPMKVGLLLEELGLDYETIPVDILKGDQHEPAFRALNPNGKVPVIVDGDVTVFDSNAIILYLAEKHRRFLPVEEKERGAALSWLFFVATGLSPFSGQAVHFLRHAPETLPYAQNRYLKETQRHYQVIEDHLATNAYLAGNEYSIADMAFWGWANMAPVVFGDEGLAAYPRAAKLHAEITARPAAQRANLIKDRFQLKTGFDAETHRVMFPQNH